MADQKMASPLVMVLIFALVGGILSLVLSNFLPFFRDYENCHYRYHFSPRGRSGRYSDPTSSQEAPEAIRDGVLLSYNIMVHTRQYAAAYVGNKLGCVSCRFKGGLVKS